ncbi:MAG: hypothetical protein AB8I08_17235 [Sandaracinaceae bacterium]
MTRRRIGWMALTALLLVGGGVAVGGWAWLRVPIIDSSREEGVAAFSQVLNGQTGRQDEALSRLAGAIDRDPDDARAHLWFGLANLHGYIRNRELPYAIRASRALERAVELDPGNTTAEGWRAFFAYQAAEARGQDLDVARRALLDAAQQSPRFTPFLAAVALADLPLESGVPAALLPPLEALEDCGDGTSDSCRRTALFPHGAEGYHATVGDLRVRLGDLEGGQRAYAQALAFESARTWPHREAFEAWVESAPERSARLTNARSDDDPPVFFASGDRACAMCHQAE